MRFREYTILFLFVVFVGFFNHQVFAEKLMVAEECERDKLILTVLTSEKPIEDASVYIYRDLEMKKFEDKLITDNKGRVELQFSERTSAVKISKEGYETLVQTLSCIEEFRAQQVKVFSVVDSSVGIIEDTNTKLTVVDLGSFYGIAGNGTVPDTINVYRDNILWKSATKDTGIAPSTSHSEWQIPQTFFYNELPGRYKLSLITNNTETLTFEFLVKQITESDGFFQTDTGDDSMEKNEHELDESDVAPLKQIAKGTLPKDVVCKEGMVLMFKNSGNVSVCVKASTADKLVMRNWGIL